jgi:predicted transcriptional regulator
MAVDKKIKIKMLELGIEQKDLATEYGCHESLISRALNGREMYPKLNNFLENRLGIKLN